MAERALDAVTFDFWNTLVSEVRGARSARLEAWAGILEEEGFGLERELLHAAYEKTWQRHVSSWEAGEQYLAARAAEDLVDALGFDMPVDVRESLLTAFLDAGNHAELRLADGIEDCLRALRAAGLRIGIICDVGFTPS